MIAAAPILELREVCKRYTTPRGEVRVLDAATLTVAPRDFLALTGPSGSGKTTLLNLAALLDRPTSGEVLFDGQPTTRLSDPELAPLRKRGVGMVFQGFHLLPHRSAIENVVFRFRYMDIPPEEARERAEQALDKVGLDALAEQPARLLSGGEMQRVAIARAVASKPRLLIADEPTGNLDRTASEQVMKLFAQLNGEGICIVLATHNQSLLGHCNRVVALDNGRAREVAS